MPTFSGPITISAAGVYTLQSNIYLASTFSGAAIQINSDDVVIDLNGYSIVNTGSRSTTQNIGVASTDHSNITVKNGTLSNFFYGVKLDSTDAQGTATGGHSVNNLDVNYSTFRGIAVFGQDSIIQYNTINTVSGTKVFQDAFAAGIEVFGPRGMISDNTVNEVYGTSFGEGLGISVSNNGLGTVVQNNVIGDSVIDDFRSYGIWVGGDSDVISQFNTISGFTYGQGWSSANSGGLIANNVMYGVIKNYEVTSPNVTIADNNVTYLSDRIDNAIGTNGDDTYIALGGNDVLDGIGGDDTFFGGGGNDILLGRDGADNLIGNIGNDILSGGAGADLLQGGAGSDTADYSSTAQGSPATQGIIVSLADNSLNTGDAQGDQYLDVENLRLTAGNDVAFGNSGNNIIEGGLGDDILYGGEGDDTFSDARGADAFFGGLGADTIDYSPALGGATVDLLSPTDKNSGAAAGDTYDSIENVILTNYADLAYMTNGDNVASVGGGNDTIFGRGGNDQIYGGNGNDLLFGGEGADFISGGEGFDYARYDELDYPPVVVSLSNQALNSGGAIGDVLVGIEGLILSTGDDVGYGNASSNWIYGRAGNDTLYGYQGQDTLYGGDGADKFMFDTRPSAANVDKVADFVSGSDKIGLASYFFGSAKSGASLRLVEGVNVHAPTSAATFLFDTKTKVLSFEADGNGKIAAVAVATLPGVDSLNAKDFFFA